MSRLEMEGKLQVLHFLLHDAHFCIEIKYIEKILPLVLIEAVPNSPKYLVGLMNYAGQSIPVIDLAIYLGFARDHKYSLDTPILLCSDENHTVGIIVDHAIGLDVIEEKSIQMHEEFNTDESPFIAAITLKTEVALLINTKRILGFNLTTVKHLNRTNDKIQNTEAPL